MWLNAPLGSVYLNKLLFLLLISLMTFNPTGILMALARPLWLSSLCNPWKQSCSEWCLILTGSYWCNYSSLWDTPLNSLGFLLLLVGQWHEMVALCDCFYPQEDVALPLFASVACLDLLKAAARNSTAPWIEYVFMVRTNKCSPQTCWSTGQSAHTTESTGDGAGRWNCILVMTHLCLF